MIKRNSFLAYYIRVVLYSFIVYILLGCTQSKTYDIATIVNDWNLDTRHFVRTHCEGLDNNTVLYSSKKDSIRFKILDFVEKEFELDNILVIIELDFLHQLGDPKIRIIDKKSNVFYYKYDEKVGNIVPLAIRGKPHRLDLDKKCTNQCIDDCDNISYTSQFVHGKFKTAKVTYY